LGALAYPFYRKHAEISPTDQEAYRWPLVAEAARNAMSIRYQLLTYLYTAVYKQNQTGLPTLNPMFFNNLDDDVSVVQDTVSEIDFKYEGGKLSMTGSFEYDAGVNVETITLLGVDSKPEGAEDADCDEDNKKLVLHVDVPLTGKYEATIA
jgi:hypothetical protein